MSQSFVLNVEDVPGWSSGQATTGETWKDSMKELRIAAVVLVVVFSAVPASAQTVAIPAMIHSRGPLTNPPAGAVLAEVSNISAGPHVFRAIVSVVGAGTAVLLEWRGPRAIVKWSQMIIVTPEAGTVVVPIQEAQNFEEGDRLRLTILPGVGITVGTVWASLSVQ
jgi:hypothetical protein